MTVLFNNRNSIIFFIYQYRTKGYFNMDHNLCRILSSERSSDSASSTDFSIYFNNMKQMERVNKIVCKGVDIPNVFYNISSTGYNSSNSGNSTFSYETLTVPASVTIPNGNYTVTELLALLIADAGLTALGFNAVLDANTNKITFTSTTTINYLSESSGNTMARALGILADSGETLSHVAPGFVNLSGVQEIYLYSQKISDGSNMVISDSTSIPCLAHIPITVDFGQTEHYLTEHPELDDVEYPSLREGTTLREIDISVRDKYGNVLDLGGLEMTIILKIYHVVG